MKKVFKLVSLFFILFIPTLIINAQTLGQLETELNQKQAELDKNTATKAQTASNIASTNAKINNIYAQMSNIEKEIQAKTAESNQLEIDIKEKQVQSKEVMRYYQVSSSGSAMLEYVMGASSLTDFIYRVSITRQITDYNNKMVKKMNEMIAQNEQIKKELAAKETEMAEMQKQLSAALTVLNNTKNDLDTEAVSLSDSIKEMRSTIAAYKKLGCSTNESLTACANRVNALPSGTTFFRPTERGSITSGFGFRSLGDYHYGVDIGVGIGTRVYPVAAGKVIKTKSGGDSCGIQMILHHYINGRYYTSYYCHLSALNASVGDVVTKDTVIAYSGNTGYSTGPHLHLGMATGRWYVDYYTYYGSNSYTAHAFDPRNVIIFASSWSNR